MPRYTADSVDRVRDTVDFIDLVSLKTDLKRSGAGEYTGLCPFHDERTPSFHVNSLNKVYYCFGCQASGNLFNYVMEIEGLDFPGAVEYLADRYGVQLELEEEDLVSRKRRERRERLFGLLERTAKYYQRLLWETEEAEHALNYLKKRGLSEEALQKYTVGYSPKDWDRISLASLQAGFSEEELLAVGLAGRSQKTGKLYDRFRGRIMFPLADERGRVIGFGARSLSDEDQPKYLNTNEGELYNKGGQLYGINFARVAATKTDRVLLAEGYTDVIALAQAGIEDAVGLMGTALTEQQVNLLAKTAKRLYLMLDADSAGQKAILKAAMLARKRELELLVVKLPIGSDPAEVIATGGSKQVEELIKNAIPVEQFQVEQILVTAEQGSVTDKDRLLLEISGIFAMLPASSFREHLIRLVSARLNLSEQLVQSMLENALRSQETQNTFQADSAPRTRLNPLSAREEAEKAFLAYCIALPDQAKRVLKRLPIEQLFTDQRLLRVAQHLSKNADEPLRGLQEQTDRQLMDLVAELVIRAGKMPVAKAALEVAALQLEKAALESAIAQARANSDSNLAELAQKRQELIKKIGEVIAA